jgi:hypothetical protein
VERDVGDVFPAGPRRTVQAQGEWRLAWILGGRGVQDLLFAKGVPADLVTQIGRKVGDEIVQDGQALDGSSLERWTFSEITEGPFHWRAESSRDGGKTWRLDQEMWARRAD